MPLSRPGYPPCHAGVLAREHHAILDDPWSWSDRGRGVRAVQRRGVHVEDDDAAARERSEQWGPPDQNECDEQHKEDREYAYPARLHGALGGGGRAVPDLVLDLLPERNDLARVEDGRVRARDDAHEKREGEVAHREPTEE